MAVLRDVVDLGNPDDYCISFTCYTLQIVMYFLQSNLAETSMVQYEMLLQFFLFFFFFNNYLVSALFSYLSPDVYTLN